MAKSKRMKDVPMMAEEQPPYDHRIEMKRTEGPMKMSHIMPMGKTKEMTKKTVMAMIEKMFGSGTK